MCFSRQREYPATTAAVPAARDFAMATMIAAVHPKGWSVADDTLLVVSELMTACLETDARRVNLRLELHWEHIDVTLTDDRTQRVATLEPALVAARGLILEELTSATDSRFLTDGRTVSSASVSCAPEYLRSVACELRPR